MTDPWLSVLIPVYNGAATLTRTLDSMAIQSEGVEALLVNQASTDDSRAIAETYRDRLRIEIIDAPENENWVQNTNLALSRATAPVSCLLHQDDLWRPGRSELVRRLIDRWPDAALWVHGAEYIDITGRRVGTFAPPFGRAERQLSPETALADLLVQNTIALPAVAFRTETARRIGGLDQTLWYTADWDFWLKLARSGPLAWSPQRAAAFRIHGGSLTLAGSRDLPGFARQLGIPLERHLEALPQPQRARTERLANASNALNIHLAARFHEDGPPLMPVLGQLARLGPLNWPRFLRSTRIVQRVWPRLKLRRQRPAP